MIDGISTEDAPGEICAEYGLMDHIDLGQSAPVRKREDSCLSFTQHTGNLAESVTDASVVQFV